MGRGGEVGGLCEEKVYDLSENSSEMWRKEARDLAVWWVLIDSALDAWYG